MRRTWLTAGLVVVALGSVAGAAARRAHRTSDPVPQEVAAPAPAPEAPPAAKDDPKAAEDLAWARQMNDAKYVAPREWRKGTVSPRTLATDAVKRTKDRFEVKFPSGAPITTPAVHRGKVLVSGGFHGKEFYAVDAYTGEPRWGRDLDDDGPSAPACEDGICVFNTESCTIFALSADTGELQWAWWMGDPMMSAPAIGGGVVFTSYPAAGVDRHPDASHVLAALDLRTGAVRWTRWLDGDVMSAPVVSGDDVLVTTFTGSVLTMARADGTLKAAHRGRATSAPTVADGKVFWSNRSEAKGEAAKEGILRATAGSMATEATTAVQDAPYLDEKVQMSSGYAAKSVALDAGNGFSGGAPSTANAQYAVANVGRGTVSGLQAYQGSRIANDGDNNYAAMGSAIVCTDPVDGKERWRHEVAGDVSAGGAIVASPAIAGGKLVAGTLNGQVLILDRKTGEVLRRIEIGGPIRSQVVVQDGWVYAGTDDGRLVGVDTGDRTLTGWPMWGGNAARTAAVD
jgi:outer membrane protein assembly factor BamB